MSRQGKVSPCAPQCMHAITFLVGFILHKEGGQWRTGPSSIIPALPLSQLLVPLVLWDGATSPGNQTSISVQLISRRKHEAKISLK